MILTKQHYKNLNRKYYHGAKQGRIYQSGIFEECLEKGVSRYMDKVGPYILNENYELVSYWAEQRYRKFMGV